MSNIKAKVEDLAFRMKKNILQSKSSADQSDQTYEHCFMKIPLLVGWTFFSVGWSPEGGVLPPTPGQGATLNDDNNLGDSDVDDDDDYDSGGDDDVGSCE